MVVLFLRHGRVEKVPTSEDDREGRWDFTTSRAHNSVKGDQCCTCRRRGNGGHQLEALRVKGLGSDAPAGP